jgi:cephalosporin hydroxylase
MLSRFLKKIRRIFLVAKIYLTSENPWYITAFWRHFYQRHKRTHDNTFWLGVNAVKPPTDLWVYQEIIYEKKPDVIIETGTKYGGTTFYLATICDLVGHGKIVTVDIEPRERRAHPRITYLTGSSIDDSTIAKIKSIIKSGDRVMVILDSDHHYPFVKDELPLYAKFVTSGQYLILEDTSVNGNPVFEEYPDGGPMQAVEEFVPAHPEFSIDRSREKFWITYNPKGYLLKR